MSDFVVPLLPDELVVDMILWRLPIKSIIEYRYVCKSWYSLITSSYFIKTQLLRKTLTHKNPQIFLFLNRIDIRDEFGSCLLLFDKQDYFNSMLFNIPLNYPRRFRSFIQIIGSVNGLICYFIGRGSVSDIVNFFIFNPSIGHFISIPSPLTASVLHYYNVVKGFGFDEKTQDFNIFLISGPDAFIYSLNLNRWRRIPGRLPNDGDWQVQCQSVVYVNSRFHWLVSCHCGHPGREKLYNFIMVFDLSCEAFDTMPLHKSLAKSTRITFKNLTEYGESSIAVVQAEGCVIYLWVLKEYGSKKSWIKIKVANPQLPYPESLNPQDQVLGFRNKDELLIRYANGCIGSQKINYNKLELEEEVEKLMDVDKHPALSFKLHKYVSSLVLLDKENNVDVAAPTYTKRIRTVYKLQKENFRIEALEVSPPTEAEVH